MPSRNIKSRQDYMKTLTENNTTVSPEGRLLSFDDQSFEMMSVPDGGAGNKGALDSLKRTKK